MPSSHLKKALQSFYKREKNRLVFPNNMSLNQLAFEMWERLGYHEIDASVISRVLHGERLFSPKQLEVFCDVIGTTEEERNKLRDALLGDYYTKHGIDINLSISPYLFNLIEEYIETIYKIQVNGNPELALELSEIVLCRVRSMINETSFAKYSSIVYKLLTEALFEKANCYLTFIAPMNALKYLVPIVKNLREITEITKDKETLGLSLLILGEAQYVSGKFENSLINFKRTLNYIQDSNRRMRIFRVMALDSAYLQRKEIFYLIRKKAYGELNKNISVDIGRQSSLYEGIGRAEGIFRLNESNNTLDLSTRLYQLTKNKFPRNYFHETQTIRSRLEIIRFLGSTNKNYLEKIGKKGLQLATLHGYKRHERKIRKILNEILN